MFDNTMPSSIFSLAAYREGIRRAHKAGHITYADSYPHLRIMEKGPHGCSWYIQDADVFRMPHEALHQIYGKLNDPYIHHQHIGYYPGELDLPSAGFDIIYDMFGPLHRKDVGSIVDAYARLSEKRMLFFVFHEGYEPGEMMMEGAKKRLTPIFGTRDTVVVDPRHYSAIVARENNPLARCFRKKFKSEFQTVIANDLLEFLKWLQGGT